MGGVTITLTRVMGSSSTGLGVTEVLMHRVPSLKLSIISTSNSHECMESMGKPWSFMQFLKSCLLSHARCV